MDFSLNPDIITLNRHVFTTQKARADRKHRCTNALSELVQLLNAIQTAAKAIRKASMALIGNEGRINVQGEEVKKLDVFANETFINMLKSSCATCLLVSEENEEIIEVETENQGRYIVCFDPLDGSANVESFLPIGSIFAIFKKENSEAASAENVLQSSKNIVAAGYVLYSRVTVIILSFGDGVDEFMLDTSIGEFILTKRDIKIPSKGNTYSVNEAYDKSWEESIIDYIQFLKKGDTKYKARYVGAMVSDLHRIIKEGGIFLYPATSDAPLGKLRLLYECIPMAYLVTQAGGLATNGRVPILDIIPHEIHQRSPIFIGSKENMEELSSIIGEH